jgi:putative aldouronate transport system permease protein
MYGATLAFKKYNIALGIMKSPWIGFENFEKFFSSYYFWRLLRNTVLLSVYKLAFGFPAPILLALLINELRFNNYKRVVQTISYIPHFFSMVVVCGIIVDFTRVGGVISRLVYLLGGPEANLLTKPELFRTIYVASDIWKEVGYSSIIFLAAIIGISPHLYEAAEIDGAGRFRQIWNITIPGILPTIVILLILNIGKMMNIGFEKVILLYNAMTYETADIISSFVYRKGLLDADYSYSTAIGLFNSVINFALLLGANTISRYVNETSLW